MERDNPLKLETNLVFQHYTIEVFYLVVVLVVKVVLAPFYTKIMAKEVDKNNRVKLEIYLRLVYYLSVVEIMIDLLDRNKELLTTIIVR